MNTNTNTYAKIYFNYTNSADLSDLGLSYNHFPQNFLVLNEETESTEYFEQFSTDTSEDGLIIFSITYTGDKGSTITLYNT